LSHLEQLPSAFFFAHFSAVEHCFLQEEQYDVPGSLEFVDEQADKLRAKRIATEIKVLETILCIWFSPRGQ